MTAHLSPAEMRVLRLRAQGYAVKEVGVRLGLGTQTVKNYIYDAYRKLDVENLASALIAVGWLKVEDPE